jgi:hypothetical protein
LTAPEEIGGQVDWSQSNNSLIIQPSPNDRIAGTMQKLTGARGSARGQFARRSYSVVLDRDGSFRVEDVEAGVYDLIILVNEPSRDPRGFLPGRDLLGTARRVVSVPAMPGGRSDQPLDLGAIPLQPAKK